MITEREIHRVFVISVLLKAAHAAIEVVSGIALYLISTAQIVGWVRMLTQQELSQDPTDFIAGHLLRAAENFSVSTQSFYAFYLVSHGVVKVGLAAGLLRRQLWAYPASLVVLGLFIVYQLYRYSYTHGIGLIALTILDLVVIVLIWHEYRLMRHHLPVE